jgi:hypothetical protein
MHALELPEILEIWERGQAMHPVDRALALLARSRLAATRDELAALTLGERDMLLLRLRAATFGDAVPATARCPSCGERLEFTLGCRDLIARVESAFAPAPCRVVAGEYAVRARPVNTFDLAAIARSADAEAARGTLLARCVVEAARAAEPVAADGLPPPVQDAVAQALCDADPAAEILIDVDCPDCRHRWRETLDVAALLWSEVTARAQRLLVEVHLLARAYGWAEHDILALSRARREAYLQMVSA